MDNPVYNRHIQPKNKLDLKWKPFSCIIEKTGPLTYKSKNQLLESTSIVDAEMLRLKHNED